MTHIFGVPVPSLEQIIVGTELVFILYIPKRVVTKLDDEFRLQRNRIIDRHVKTEHNTRLKHCADLACASLRTKEGSLSQSHLEALSASEVIDIEI